MARKLSVGRMQGSDGTLLRQPRTRRRLEAIGRSRSRVELAVANVELQVAHKHCEELHSRLSTLGTDSYL